MNESGASSYKLTDLLEQLLTSSQFKKWELQDYYAKIAATYGDTSSDEAIVRIQAAAFKQLYDESTTTDAQREEMLRRKESAWDDIRLRTGDSKYFDAYESDKHYALAWIKLVNNSERIAMDELDMEILAQFLHEMDDTLHVYVKLWFNIDNVYSSSLEVTVTREILGEYEEATVVPGSVVPSGRYYEEVEISNETVKRLTADAKFVENKKYYVRAEEQILAVMYDGSENTRRDRFSGKVYVTTTLLGIGNVVLEDITGVVTAVYDYFGANFMNSMAQNLRGFFGVEDETSSAANAPEDETLIDYATYNSLHETQKAVTYLRILFERNEFSLNVYKNTLISLVYLLTGNDITESISDLDFGTSVKLTYGNTVAEDITTGMEARIYFSNNQEKSDNFRDNTAISIGVGGINVLLKSDLDDVPPTSDGKGYVTVEQRRRSNGSKCCNVYRCRDPG